MRANYGHIICLKNNVRSPPLTLNKPIVIQYILNHTNLTQIYLTTNVINVLYNSPKVDDQ